MHIYISVCSYTYICESRPASLPLCSSPPLPLLATPARPGLLPMPVLLLLLLLVATAACGAQPMPIIQLGVPSTQHEPGRGRRKRRGGAVGGATMTGPLGPPSAGTEITHAKAHKGVACKQTETHAHIYILLLYTHT